MNSADEKKKLDPRLDMTPMIDICSKHGMNNVAIFSKR